MRGEEKEEDVVLKVFLISDFRQKQRYVTRKYSVLITQLGIISNNNLFAMKLKK